MWHSQQSEPVPHDDVSLIVLAPTISRALHDELRLLGWEEPGIFSVAGLPFATWLVETDVMAERGQPILSLVSRVFLNDRGRIIEKLGRTGHGPLVRYMLQQIRQFRTLGKDFAMQHALSENLEELEEELLAKFLQTVPADQRVRGLPPEELLRVVPPEEFVAGLTEQQAAQLRELLERRQRR